MAENSNIEWTTHTWNPWRGCTKVSAGCAHCYAETLSGRNPGTLGVWGPNGTRVVASEAMWKEPLKWNKQAAVDRMDHDAELNLGKDLGLYQRPRVFCASLADVFEDWKGPISTASGHYARKQFDGSWITDGTGGVTRDDFPLTIQDVRTRLFRLIDATPNLDWLLLTKRPENITKHLEDALILAQGGDPSDKCFFADHGEEEPKNSTANMLNEWIAGDPPKNVWLGTSVENQAAADERIPHLLRVPAAVRFLSCEPLLGPVDLKQWLVQGWCPSCNSTCFRFGGSCRGCGGPATPLLHWVICGGESGPGARPCNVAWIRSIVEQCKAAGVPVFVKQLGGMVYDSASEPICEFASEHEWVCKARSWLGGISGGGQKYKQPEKAICVDAKDRWCEMGRDFMRATAEGTYPVTAFEQVSLRDKKGGDPAEWPADLRVRQFPEAKGAVPA